jgi:carbon monoxide dehydrogenase subunit G
MGKATSEIDIDRSADEVWKVVGDFGGLAGWMPGIEKCTVTDDVRTVETGGMEIGEQLVARDDAQRTISYSIVSGPAPVDTHQATITVTPSGSGSHVTYEVEATPDSMVEMLNGIYAQSLDALKAHVEG